MVEVIAKRNLLREVKKVDGNDVSIYFKKGEKYKLEEKEAIAFWGGLDIKEADKKKLVQVSKRDGYKRKI